MNELYNWINEKGLTELETTLRVMCVYTYIWCLFNPSINFNRGVK